MIHAAVINDDGIISAIQHALEKRRLEIQCPKHPLLERILRYHIDYLDIAVLPYTVDPAYPLFQHGGIPWQIQIDDQRCRLQVQSGTSCIRGHEHAAIRIVTEIIYQVLPLFRRHRAVQ